MPYANGETILDEGDTTDAFFYIVKQGHVAISKELAPATASMSQGGRPGAPKVSELTPKVSERLALATQGRGEFFGEMAISNHATPP